MAIKTVESYSVSPSSGAAAAHSLPLVYFDIIWLNFSLTETLHFYRLKCSESCFFDTVVVQLKHSLSLALKHFLPLASNIIFPLTSAAMPVSLYTAGDSITLTIATSDADFANLTANGYKVADEFHQFVPQLPPAVYSSDDIKFSAIAIQVTLFPNEGICIGFTHHHSICDANTLFAFLRTWASINKSNGGEHLLQDFLPFYGRDSVQDADRLTAFGWNQIKMNKPTVALPLALPLHKVRATFVLTDSQIGKLKSNAVMKNPAIGRRRASTFVVVCAHIWSCLARSAAAAGEEVGDDEPEYLGSPVNSRRLLDPPLPGNYFGNCLMHLLAVSSHGRLKGKEGFVAAAEAVAAAVGKSVENSRRVSEFFEKRSEMLSGLIGKRLVLIAGSSKLDHYGADFGWGRAVKYECIHTDFNGGIHLCKGRDGGVEIGVSMPKAKMDIFAPMFNKYLHINSNL